MSRPIPVIDLFAGPGGLGEGFSASSTASGASAFKIALSIEKDPIAHQTLTLRSFFRQFPAGDVPDEYYHRLQRKLTTSDLFNCFPEQARAAQEEAWQATLGDERNTAELRSRVRHALNGQDPWVLIGGPPCQAYSLAGRSRNKGIKDYVFAEDPRIKLYIEYLQLIADFWPAVFVMENVKGCSPPAWMANPSSTRSRETCQTPPPYSPGSTAPAPAAAATSTPCTPSPNPVRTPRPPTS